MSAVPNTVPKRRICRSPEDVFEALPDTDRFKSGKRDWFSEVLVSDYRPNHPAWRGHWIQDELLAIHLTTPADDDAEYGRQVRALLSGGMLDAMSRIDFDDYGISYEG